MHTLQCSMLYRGGQYITGLVGVLGIVEISITSVLQAGSLLFFCKVTWAECQETAGGICQTGLEFDKCYIQ